MEVGMLWYEAGPAKLSERVQRAAEYYADKYGHKPNLCLVNPEMLKGKADRFNGVQVRAAESVMPDHFWIGVDEQAKPAAKNGSGNDGARRSGSKGAKAKSKGRAAGKAAAKSGSKPKSKQKAD